MPRPVVRAAPEPPAFNIANAIGVAVIGLLATLVSAGILSMIHLYTTEATLTEQVRSTSESLAKHLDHSVDKDEYLRRDKEIQRAIDRMATKDELRDVRQTLDTQTEMLREMQSMIAGTRRR